MKHSPMAQPSRDAVTSVCQPIAGDHGRVEDWRAGVGQGLGSLLARPFGNASVPHVCNLALQGQDIRPGNAERKKLVEPRLEHGFDVDVVDVAHG
jgi:hypothetical protein